jgi:hypothetical protein
MLLRPARLLMVATGGTPFRPAFYSIWPERSSFCCLHRRWLRYLHKLCWSCVCRSPRRSRPSCGLTSDSCFSNFRTLSERVHHLGWFRGSAATKLVIFPAQGLRAFFATVGPARIPTAHSAVDVWSGIWCLHQFRYRFPINSGWIHHTSRR